MAGTGVRQMSATPVRPAVSGDDQSHEGVNRRSAHEGPLPPERKMEKNTEADQNVFPISLMVVMEQWICLALGILCMVSGILGISVNPGQNDLPAPLAWAGLGYVPLLRITAAACLASGVVLARLGWTSH